jgi:hypothetical protein|tara:strand:+ start:3824 stop:4801 length:978 start_codon:yes stop_codon:yes gene_type:complete
MNKFPFFTISFDFELFWGMRDVTTLEKYGKNILEGRKSIPMILDLFEKKGIHATWAVVGMLCFPDKKKLMECIPKNLPEYSNKKLDPYMDIPLIGKNEAEDPYHYGYSLVKKINETKGMEIASHSFSHFYCKEKRKNKKAFADDLKASVDSLKLIGVDPITYIFCRNQYEESDLVVLKKMGFKVFRGIEKSIIFDSKANFFLRLLRFVDAYINLSGPNFSEPIMQNDIMNIPSSRFLRPASNSKIEKFRVSRILKAMTEAARQNTGFHLWWHPHNFGKNSKSSFYILNQILDHFILLNRDFGMRSLNMSEVHEMHKTENKIISKI